MSAHTLMADKEDKWDRLWCLMLLIWMILVRDWALMRLSIVLTRVLIITELTIDVEIDGIEEFFGC